MTLTENHMKQFGQYFLDDLLGYIEEEFAPEEVFDTDDLELWALDNGFVREEADNAD